MKEIINSVGIDIGTSTTQLIFSKLTIENMATSYTVPRISIVNTEVVYRSDIYFTPLDSVSNIDAEKVKAIVAGEYRKANMNPKDLHTGAVIITGETARKDNANEVLSALSDMAGDFVVATAGPDLESVLSARGAGADFMSAEDSNVIANIDIGGGTSNIAVFKKGNLLATSCLDIGGRLVKVENGRISYIYTKISELAAKHGINIKVGDSVNMRDIEKLSDIMAKQLAMAVGLIPKDEFHAFLYTNDGKAISEDIKIDGIMFSGGVADIIYNPSSADEFRYNDIGPVLGRKINESNYFAGAKRYNSVETIRATVVGAGTHTTEVSGSTIRYDAQVLPLKNIPVVKMSLEDEENLDKFSERLSEKINIFTGSGADDCVAIAINGAQYTSFKAVQKMAQAIIGGLKDYSKTNVPVVVVCEVDIGKVLGNAIQVLLGLDRKVICIDSIFVKDGDYIDIGEPVANGRVVPVVIKTLIFNR